MTTTTIQVDVEVRDELRARGRMGETYNDVLRRLLIATRSREGGVLDRPRRFVSVPTNPLFAHQERE